MISPAGLQVRLRQCTTPAARCARRQARGSCGACAPARRGPAARAVAVVVDVAEGDAVAPAPHHPELLPRPKEVVQEEHVPGPVHLRSFAFTRAARRRGGERRGGERREEGGRSAGGEEGAPRAWCGAMATVRNSLPSHAAHIASSPIAFVSAYACGSGRGRGAQRSAGALLRSGVRGRVGRRQGMGSVLVQRAWRNCPLGRMGRSNARFPQMSCGGSGGERGGRAVGRSGSSLS